MHERVSNMKKDPSCPLRHVTIKNVIFNYHYSVTVFNNETNTCFISFTAFENNTQYQNMTSKLKTRTIYNEYKYYYYYFDS